nr:hypothetical protein [Moorella thermoacetica]
MASKFKYTFSTWRPSWKRGQVTSTTPAAASSARAAWMASLLRWSISSK